MVQTYTVQILDESGTVQNEAAIELDDDFQMETLTIEGKVVKDLSS